MEFLHFFDVVLCSSEGYICIVGKLIFICQDSCHYKCLLKNITMYLKKNGKFWNPEAVENNWEEISNYGLK